LKSRSKKPKPALKDKRGGPESAEAAPGLAQLPNRGRLWLFRMLALLLPILVVCGLEAGLRISGYGYSTSFFKEVRNGDKRFVVDNEFFSLRFFPPELARWPASFKFDSLKSTNSVRIFILGESAAMGDPQPAFGASRYMEVLLRQRFPKVRFEVINLGITAINSHVILPIARECARREGDIWIIYMGNNEMVGPFGAATVFGARAPSRAIVRLDLALQRMRVGQMTMRLLGKLSSRPANTSWGGMQMFLQNQIPPDDARRETVYRNFNANLRDIVELGRSSGAKILLNTVSVNLKDSPPFASLNNSKLTATARAQFEGDMEEGKAREKEHRFAEGAEAFAKAAGIDPLFAEAQFRWGDCLLKQTNAAAHEHFQRACDLDALPFRADTRINSMTRELGRKLAGVGVMLCDAAAVLETNSPVRVAGAESFFEHVHFNFDGNFRLGQLWANCVESLLPDRLDHSAAPGWASQESCEQVLGLTEWNRSFVLESVLRRLQQPPLSLQFNNEQRSQMIQADETALRQRMAQPGAVVRASEALQAAIRSAPDDHFLYEGLANFFESIHERRQAIAAYRQVHDLLPRDFYACLQLGRVLGEVGELPEAKALLQQVSNLRPSLPDGWYELGTVLAASGDFKGALESYDHAMKLRPRDPAYICYKGKVLGKLSRHAEAIAHYRRAIEIRPNFWEARFELASELAGQNQVGEAIREYTEVIRLNPRHATTRVNLGVMLVRLNKLNEAIQQFEEALRIEPSNQAAKDYLAQVTSRRNLVP